MDISGRLTTDPAVALGGLIVLARGQKGSGLVVMTGLLLALLTDAANGTRLGNVKDGPNAAVFETTGSRNTSTARSTKFLKAARPRRGPAAGVPGGQSDGELRRGRHSAQSGND